MSEFFNIKKKIQDMFLENKYDLVEVSYGYKRKNGQDLNTRCISFGVRKKLPINEIPPEKLIPSTIEIDGVNYITDVYEEVGEVVAVLNFCNDTGPGGYTAAPPTVFAPVSSNRAYVRPLSGGVSGSCLPQSGFVNTGTFGGVVVDLLDNKIVGISNNHVAGTPGGTGARVGVPYTISSNSTYGALASAYRNLEFYQPSAWDRRIVGNTPDIIGTMKRSFPFLPGEFNFIDCSLINLKDSDVGTNSWYQLSAPFTTPPDFATTAELDGLTKDNPIFRSGRTLGPLGNGTCQLSARAVFTTLNVTYTPYVISFTDVIRIDSTSTDTAVSSGGDSGTAAYALFDPTNPILSAWKFIGLVFAGNSTTGVGYICRADYLANFMQISAYKGTPVTATPNLCSYRLLDYSTYSNAVSVVIDNKTYWQLGRI